MSITVSIGVWSVTVMGARSRMRRNFTGDVGHPWRRTYSISGDATNLAARIMAHAEPGQLLVHEPVLDRVRGRVRTAPIAPFHAKGCTMKEEHPMAAQVLPGTCCPAGPARAQRSRFAR